MSSIDNLTSVEIVEEEFQKFLTNNFTGREIEAMRDSGTIELLDHVFAYAYLRGARVTSEFIMGMIHDKK